MDRDACGMPGLSGDGGGVTRRWLLRAGATGIAGSGIGSVQGDRGVGSASAAAPSDLPSWGYTQLHSGHRFGVDEVGNEQVFDVRNLKGVKLSRGVSQVDMRLPDATDADRDVARTFCGPDGNQPGVQHRFVAVTNTYGFEQSFEPVTETTGLTPTRRLVTDLSVPSTGCGAVSLSINNAFKSRMRLTDAVDTGADAGDTDVAAVRDEVRRFQRRRGERGIENPDLPDDEVTLVEGLKIAAGVGQYVPYVRKVAKAVQVALAVRRFLLAISYDYEAEVTIRNDGLRIDQAGIDASEKGQVAFQLVDFTVTVPPGEPAEFDLVQAVEHDSLAGRRLRGDVTGGAATGAAVPEYVIQRDEWNVSIPPLEPDDAVAARTPSVADPRDLTVDPKIELTVTETDAGFDDEGESGSETAADGATTHDALAVGESLTVGPIDSAEEALFTAGVGDVIEFSAIHDTAPGDVASTKWTVYRRADEPRPLVFYGEDDGSLTRAFTALRPESEQTSEETESRPHEESVALGPGDYVVALTVTTEDGATGGASARFSIESEGPETLTARIDASSETFDPGDTAPLSLDAGGSKLPSKHEGVAYEWKVWPKGAGGEELGTENTLHRFGESVSIDPASPPFAVGDADEVVVRLTAWVSQHDTTDHDALVNKLDQPEENTPGPAADKAKSDPYNFGFRGADVFFDEAELTLPVLENEAPTADFSVLPSTPTSATEVRFESTATDPDGDAIVSHEWEFYGPTSRFDGSGSGDNTRPERWRVPASGSWDGNGNENGNGNRAGGADGDDGVTDAGYATVWQDLAPGRYDVTLTVTDSHGESGETTETITVLSPDEATVSIEGPETLDPGESATYEATIDAEGSFAFEWTGDVGGSGRTTTFAPAEAGEYIVGVEVSEVTTVDIDGDGDAELKNTAGSDRTWSVERTVTVNTPPTVTVDAKRRYPPGAIELTARVENADDGDVYTFEWTGDVTATSPPGWGTSHSARTRITEIGDYTGEVTVTDRLGARTTQPYRFEVEPPGAEPEVRILGPAQALAEESVSYTARVTGAAAEITDYEWNIGDGGGPGATATFPGAGTYTVRLTVTDARGVDATATKEVTVAPPILDDTGDQPSQGRQPGAVIDDFEESDPLAAYRNPTDANWTIGTGHATSGSHNLLLDDNDYHSLYSLPGEGLPVYPRPGDTFGGRMGVVGDNVGVMFGLDPERTVGDERYGYIFRVSPYGDDIDLYRMDGTTGKTKLAATSASVQRDTTYEVTIDWGTDGQIRATVTDDGSTVATLSATDTTYGRGGFGYRAGEIPTSLPVTAWYDDWRLRRAGIDDDFDYPADELDDNGWTVKSGNFSTEDSYLTASNQTRQRIYHAQNLAAGTFDFRGVQNSATFYGLKLQFIAEKAEFGSSGYMLLLAQDRGSERRSHWQDIQLVRVDPDNRETLVTLTEDHDGELYDVRIERDPDTYEFACYLNGTQVGTARDDTYTGSNYAVFRYDDGGSDHRLDRVITRPP